MKVHLLSKYNIPAPRYTSYPTVPYWQPQPPTTKQWSDEVRHTFQKNRAISLYIHLPYCENLCTYCGCNKHITKQHTVELPYINTVLEEWKQYLALFSEKPYLKSLHLGGGTPTFFSPNNLAFLIEEIKKDSIVSPTADFSIEVHPSSTSDQHLEALRTVGFNRLSIGVQDFDPMILKVINRYQTYEQIKHIVEKSRKLGYESINFDLIFGLPFQQPKHILSSFDKVRELRPDRIAFYSYAHVPWIKPSQRAYSEKDLPKGQKKRDLYLLGKKYLEEFGYTEIGLDHFALSTDSLYKAVKNKTLHRNFMGYTPFNTSLNIGLGASAISDTWSGYVQNEKRIVAYQNRVSTEGLPILKGHILSKSDQIIRQHILNLICRYETSWETEDLQCAALYEGLSRLTEMKKDGLVESTAYTLKVTETGAPFIRNICMALDEHYWERQPEKRLFSKVV